MKVEKGKRLKVKKYCLKSNRVVAICTRISLFCTSEDLHNRLAVRADVRTIHPVSIE